MSMKRREFLKTAAVASAAASASGVARGQGTGGKYRTALIGSGWWGKNILREAMAAGESKIVALCDVDESMLKGAAAFTQEMCGDQPKLYRDYRELIEKEKPEVVIVGTPDHWHALNTIAACNAGAHVYVEKPVCHTIKEGRAMVDAARGNHRVVQVGTHRRVSPHNLSGMEFLKSGKAGKIGMVSAFIRYGGNGPETPRPNQEPPAGLDWDMWCGPAPLRPFNTKIHAKGFRGFLDYANGTLGDWGIHWLDQILWWTEEKGPRAISSSGGRHVRGAPVNDGSGQTTDAPDHQVANFEFESFTATWEHRQFAGNNNSKSENVGCYFYGTKGVFHMGWRGGWTFYPSRRGAPEIHEEPQLNQPDHQNIKELWADFLGCIKSGKRPVCDIEVAHRATNMSLLGMLSMRLGRTLKWDPDKESILDDPDASRGLRREYRGEWEYPAV